MKRFAFGAAVCLAGMTAAGVCARAALEFAAWIDPQTAWIYDVRPLLEWDGSDNPPVGDDWRVME
jgi:hypothetical protein